MVRIRRVSADISPDIYGNISLLKMLILYILRPIYNALFYNSKTKCDRQKQIAFL